MHNYRHGDVCLKEVGAFPDGIKPLETLTLAYGEVTGHHHTMVATKPESKVKLFAAADGTMYMEVAGAEAALTHQEHKTITVMPGLYVVGKEREYDPLEGWRAVQD